MKIYNPIVSLESLRQRLNQLQIKAIGNNILDRFAPQRGDPNSDALLLAMVRIGLGLILAWRSFFIATDATYYFDESELLGVRLVWQCAAGWLFFWVRFYVSSRAVDADGVAVAYGRACSVFNFDINLQSWADVDGSDVWRLGSFECWLCVFGRCVAGQAGSNAAVARQAESGAIVVRV